MRINSFSAFCLLASSTAVTGFVVAPPSAAVKVSLCVACRIPIACLLSVMGAVSKCLLVALVMSLIACAL